MKTTNEVWKAKDLLWAFKLIEDVLSPRNNSADPFLKACLNLYGKWFVASMYYLEKNKWTIFGPFNSKDELLDGLARNYIWARETNELRPEYEERLLRMGL